MDTADLLDKKSQRFRSVAYPSYTISESFELVRKINQQFGNTTFNTREEIAQQLNMGVSTLMMKLSTATQYGLLEMKSKEGYKPSPLFTSIYKPLDDAEKIAAEIQCLNNSELYVKLIEQYRGKQLPAMGGLGILLYRSHKVSEDASGKAAKVFLENLSELNLIDASNHLKSEFISEEIVVNEPIQQKAEEFTYTTEPIRKQLNPPPKLIDISTPINEDILPIPVFLRGVNRMAKVLIPVDFTNEDLDQIVKVISANKRPE